MFRLIPLAVLALQDWQKLRLRLITTIGSELLFWPTHREVAIGAFPMNFMLRGAMSNIRTASTIFMSVVI